MAERVVRVKLTATMDQYVAAMGKAADATRSVGKETEKLAQTKQAFDMVGRSALALGGLAAVGVGVAISKFADFQQAISYVAATGDDAKASIEGLREAALDAGARTVYSATEAANAIEELAKAGVEASDILSGGLDGALDLAAAGGLAVADAAGIAATALKTFNLEGSDMSHVADLLSAGAGKAMGSVGDLSAALNQSALVASKTGLSIEETTAGLAAFASQGLLGSDAGTSFKTMLLSLNPTSDKAAELMKTLNLEAYDGQGKFIGLAAYAGKLESALGGMGAEQQNATLKTIFGNDAYRAAAVLLDEGASGIEEWTAKVNAPGYAAETAATRLDNLRGDLEKLTGAFDSALISMGSAADGPFRALIQNVTMLVDGFNGMPVPLQQAAFWVGAAGTAALVAGGAYLLAVPKIAAYNAVLLTLGSTAQRTGRLLGALSRGAVIGAVATVAIVEIDAFSKAITERLLPSAEQVDNKMRSAKSGVELFASALNSEGITNTKEAADLLKNLGTQLDAVASNKALAGISGTAYTVGKSLGDLAKSDLPLAQAQLRKLAEDANLTDAQMSTFIDTNQGLKDALTAQATAAGLTADKQTLLRLALEDTPEPAKDAAAAYKDAAGEAADLTSEIDALIESINKANGVGQDAVSANADYQAALAGISEEVERQKTAYEEANGTLDGFNLSLDQNTVAGSANASMLADVAGSAQAAAESQYQVDLTTMSAKDASDKYAATLSAQRTAFEESATAAGFNKDEVKKLADEVFALPSEKTIDILANTAGAITAIENLKASYQNNTIWLRTAIDSGASDATLAGMVGVGIPSSENGNMFSYANGGFGSGIYSGGAPLYKFAEPETGWEAFISGKSSERGRNIGIWQQAGERLGVGGGSSGGATSVSLAGATLVATVDGVPLRLMIQDQVVQAEASSARNADAGRRVRY